MNRRGWLALLATPALAFAAPAARAADLSVSDAWIRSLGPEVPAGGYFHLSNSGKDVAVLTGAQSASCGSLSLHKTILNRPMSARAEGSTERAGGMAMGAPTMQMRPVSSLPVPPGGQVSFTPGGYHLMCEQPSADLHPGGNATVTLRFADGRTLPVNFAVRGPRG